MSYGRGDGPADATPGRGPPGYAAPLRGLLKRFLAAAATSCQRGVTQACWFEIWMWRTVDGCRISGGGLCSLQFEVRRLGIHGYLVRSKRSAEPGT